MTVPASPLAQRLARLSRLNLDDVRGSGDQGRVQARDVINALDPHRKTVSPASMSDPKALNDPSRVCLRARFPSGSLAEFSSGIEGWLSPMPLHHALLFVIAQCLTRHPALVGEPPDCEPGKVSVQLAYSIHGTDRSGVIENAGQLRLRSIGATASNIESAPRSAFASADEHINANFIVEFQRPSVSGEDSLTMDPAPTVPLLVATAQDNEDVSLALAFTRDKVSQSHAEAFLRTLELAVEDPRRLLL